MATEHILSESWTEIVGSDKVSLSSVVSNGTVLFNDSATAPVDNFGHPAEDGGGFSYSGPNKVYARVEDDETTGTVIVSEVDHPTNGLGQLLSLSVGVFIGLFRG